MKKNILGILPDSSVLMNQCEKSESSSESSDASTIHIVEDVVESKSPSQIKFQVQNRIDDDSGSCNSSISEPEKCLHNEMMKLCYEIESVNGMNSDDNDDSSVDLNFQEEKHLRNVMDKVKTHLKMTISLFIFFFLSFQFPPDRRKNNLRDVRENHR